MTFCYFTCSRDFNLLLLSIKKLRTHNNVGTIFISIDNKDPLSNYQQGVLKELNVIIHPLGFNYHGNLRSKNFPPRQHLILKNIMDITNSDHVMKIDSDTFFLTDWFNTVPTGDLCGFSHSDGYILGCASIYSLEWVRYLIRLSKRQDALFNLCFYKNKGEDQINSALARAFHRVIVDAKDFQKTIKSIHPISKNQQLSTDADAIVFCDHALAKRNDKQSVIYSMASLL